MDDFDVSNLDSLRAYILQNGCYSPEENLRIYEKWFSAGPRYLFRAVSEKYGLTKLILADAGCAYGSNLVYCTPDSYGIEIEKYGSKFARSLGLNVYNRNILTDDLTDLTKADAVWCSAVLEHVDSPHIFLRKLHGILKPGGLLCLYVPTIPLFPALKHVPRFGHYFIGHTHSDHINAFVPKTLRFFCEQAGLETVEVSPFYPGPFKIFNHVPFARQIIDGCVYIGRKIPGWEYPQNSTRRVADNAQGFVFVGQRFPEEKGNQIDPHN